MKECEDFSLEEGLLRGEGNDWAVVLVEFETDEDEDASGYFWLFGGGHLSERDEVFVAERRTSEKGGCEEDIVHVALEGKVLSINKVSTLEAILLFCALLTFLEMLLKLSCFTTPMPIDRKRDKSENSHIKNLTTANLSGPTSQPLRHHISYKD